MTDIPDTLLKLKEDLLKSASPRRAEAINAIFSVCSDMLKEGLHISVVSVGERTSQIKGGPTARTIYNTTDPYGNLVQAFAQYQSSQKPGELLASKNLFELPSLEDVIEGLDNPAHKAVIRDFEHNAMKTRDRLRILENFVSKITAQNVARLTNPNQQTSQSEIQRISSEETTSENQRSQSDKETLRHFVQDILFDEGYEHHDGDIFHAPSGRSIRAEKFVSLLKKLDVLT